MVSAAIAAHLLPGRLGQSGRDGDQGDQGLAAVGAHRPAAQRAGLVGDRREPGECFQVGQALVAQAVLGWVEMNAAPHRAHDQEVLIRFMAGFLL